jgi:hypothetical protein
MLAIGVVDSRLYFIFSSTTGALSCSLVLVPDAEITDHLDRLNRGLFRYRFSEVAAEL